MIHVNGILDRVAGLAEELKLANLQPQLGACRQQLGGSESIDVAVFGRFKAGKSSFLNHLTGRAVLPIGVVPLTAVITRLRYGPVERAEVHFLNGTSKTIPLDEIGLYVGENENPNNEKQVAAVEVELPALKPLAPLQFVDTPGLGSALAHNTEAAMRWLPNVGAALVAVSADAPLSERDLELLKELRRHTPKIVLLLTKADLLTEPQRAEVLKFVRQQLRKKFGGSGAVASSAGGATESGPRREPWETGDAGQALAGAAENVASHQGSTAPTGASANSQPSHGLHRGLLSDTAPQLKPTVDRADIFPVFFYSIQPMFAGLKATLEADLLTPLLRNRSQAAEEIIRHKLGSLVGQTLDYLRVALAAATQAASARAALAQRLSEERGQLDALREELHVLTYEWSGQALEASLQRLDPDRRALQAEVTAALQAQFPRWRLRLPAFIHAYGQWLRDLLNADVAAVSQARRAVFCEPLDKTRQHLTRALRAFQDRLAQHVQEALGVTLTRHEFTLAVQEPEAPPVDVSTELMVPVDVIGNLVPMVLFRPLFERKLLRRARYEVEKNLSRLAADWRERVNRAIQELNGQALQCAVNELDALERMVAQTQSKAPELKQAMDELEQFQKRLRG